MSNLQISAVFAMLLFALSSILSAPALANSAFDGTFSHVGRGVIEYFSLTETGSEVAGFYYSVAADPTASGGIKETRVNVSGVTDGNRVNFRQGQGAFSTTLGWVARNTYGGFSLNFPSNGGYLGEAQFRRTSVDEVNVAISSLRQAVGQQRQLQAATQQRAQLENEIEDSQRRLDVNFYKRPAILKAMVAAKAAVRKAEGEVARANADMAAREADVVTAQRAVDAADAIATTNDDRVKVNDLRVVVNDRRSDVNTARSNINTAQSDLRSAQFDLDSAHRDLAALDARIVQLRQIVARDKQYVGRQY